MSHRFVLKIRMPLVALSLAIGSTLSSVAPATAIDFSLFKDSEDGAFDVSEWLGTRYGFMPIPIIVTEPAVGYGGGFALVFLHPDNKAGDADKGRPGMLPPSISAVAGAYTENGTWFAGGGHFGSWKDDSIRYTGGVGWVDANLDFYVSDRPVALNLDGAFLMQEMKFRIGDSHFFLGGKWLLFDSEARFQKPSEDPSSMVDFPEIDPDGFKSTNSGLGAVAYFDSRDNIFTPNKGLVVDLEILRYDPAIGGDFDYWYAKLEALWYLELHSRFGLGLRIGGESVDGDAPFYAYPFVQLRGVAAMRYQGEQVAQVEVEGRWRVYKRWSLIGFVGKGDTWADAPRLDTDDNIVTYGAGFRYLIARKFGAHAGIDVAQGPEDTVIYLQFGSAWGR